MTSEDIEKFKEWYDSLSPEGQAGVQDAVKRIYAGRMPKGKGGELPPEWTEKVDPELDEPEDPKDEDEDKEGLPPVDIDDPDNLLKGKGEDDGGKKEDEKETEREKKAKEFGDATKDAIEDPSNSGASDDTIEDDDIDLPDNVKKTKEEEERKKAEAIRRKAELATLRKEIKRAKGKDGLDPELEPALDELDATLADALQKIIDDPDSITETSGKTFDEMIESAYELLEKAGRKSTKITDVTSRIERIRDALEDIFELEELEREDAINIERDPETIKTREQERLRREMEKYRASSHISGGINAFKKDLLKAISDQIQEMIDVEEETYAIVDRHHEEDDIASPGIRIDEIPDYKKPSINVYFDQSGSWGYEEVKKGMAALKEIIDLEEEDLLLLKIAFFSEIISTNQAAARAKGWAECWDKIIEDIKNDKAKNVIIMTDRDIGRDYGQAGLHGCRNGPGLRVPGCVWFLWKTSSGGKVSRDEVACTKLRGDLGTFEYTI